MISLTQGDSMRHSTVSLFSTTDSWEEDRYSPYDVAHFVDRVSFSLSYYTRSLQWINGAI